MTKNVEYEISLIEVIKLIKSRWKLVCIITVLFIILCGGYKIASNASNNQIITHDDYDSDVELYDSISRAEQALPDLLREEWENISYDTLNNPIFTIDPYNCEYEQIVIRFKDESKNHDWTVNNWVSKADNKRLFENQEDTLSQYKTSLILVAQKEEKAETAETAVQVLLVDSFDTKKATEYLINLFKRNAEEDNIAIDKISSVSAKGYNEYVDKYQQKNRDRYKSIYEAFTYSKQMGSNIAAPISPETERQDKIKDVIKYCLIGLILGLLLAVAYVVFDVIRKHEITSTRQVSNSFDLELLGNCCVDDEVSLDVLNANLDVMTEEHSRIAVITEDLTGDLGRIASEWTKKSDREFMFCKDIFEDPESIEALKKTEGIVIGIKIGKSKLDQIQRIILRTNKLNLNVLGYVLL